MRRRSSTCRGSAQGGDDLELRVSTLGSTTPIRIAAQRHWTLRELRAAIAKSPLGVPSDEQQLVWGITELRGAATLSELLHLGPCEEGAKADLYVIWRQPEHARWLQRVEANGMLLGKAPLSIRNDHEVARAAAAQDCRAVQFFSESLLADPELGTAVLQAFSKVPELRARRGVCLAALRLRGSALCEVPAAMRSDREVVLAAVRQDAHALQHADAELRADREVVLAAVKQNPYALRHAPARFRADKEVMLAAVRRSSNAAIFATEDLVEDCDFARVALAADAHTAGENAVCAIEATQVASGRSAERQNHSGSRVC